MVGVINLELKAPYSRHSCKKHSTELNLWVNQIFYIKKQYFVHSAQILSRQDSLYDCIGHYHIEKFKNVKTFPGSFCCCIAYH